jgi:hypothetical protein
MQTCTPGAGVQERMPDPASSLMLFPFSKSGPGG